MFEPLSRQASQNAMGPWFIRDEANPYLPGFSLATLRQMVRRGRITPETIIKGPSTRQFWAYARSVPGVAHLLGVCHVCKAPANADQSICAACGTSFEVQDDREHLGLTPVRLLPGHADPAQIAESGTTGTPTARTAAASPTHRERPPPPMAVYTGPEIDAAAMIAARQRQRRAQRRKTIGVIVLVVVIIGLGAALAAALSSQGRSGNASGTQPSTPSTDNRGSLPAATTPEGAEGKPDDRPEPADPGLEKYPTKEPEVREPQVEDVLGRLVTATLDDLPQAIEAAQLAAAGTGGDDPRLQGAIAAAQQRLAVLLAGRRF